MIGILNAGLIGGGSGAWTDIIIYYLDTLDAIGLVTAPANYGLLVLMWC